MFLPLTFPVHRHDIKSCDAVSSALDASTLYSMPQTVYRNADTAGWTHTNALANLLQKSEVYVTVLPENYFS